VIAFFVVTYLISWPLFFVSIYLFADNMAVGGTLGAIAGFGPALAGMIVTASGDDEGNKKRRGKRPVAFIVAWLVSLAVMVLFTWRVRGAEPRPGLVIFIGLLATIPAFVISGGYSKKDSIRRYLSTLARPRGPAAWYVVALLTFPAVQFIAHAIMRLTGSDTGSFSVHGYSLRTFSAIVLTFLFGLLFAGGVNEESGWRGFAVPKMQRRHPPLVAAAVVWFFWALWHLPYDMATGDSVSGVLLNRVVYNFLWSILFVWVYNGTGGSILAPAIFHASMNTSSEYFARPDGAIYLFAALAVYAVLSRRMWRRFPLKNSITADTEVSDVSPA
jgi:membrane protease YdiL (CAAX protease family)